MGGNLDKLKITTDEGSKVSEIGLRGTYENPYLDISDVCEFLKIDKSTIEKFSNGCRLLRASEIYDSRKDYHNNMAEINHKDAKNGKFFMKCSEVFRVVFELGDSVSSKSASALTSAVREQIGVNLL